MVVSRLKVLAGLGALAGAVVVLATGGGWWAFWPGGLAAALLSEPWRRRYWERVERDDPASVPLQAMWATAGMFVLALLLATVSLAGVWVHPSTGRAFGGFAAALFFGIGWLYARAERERLLRAAGEE